MLVVGRDQVGRDRRWRYGISRTAFDVIATSHTIDMALNP
jgi:hypothetical protein